MLLRPLSAGKISGTGTLDLTHGQALGGVVISTDGTNAAAVILRKTNASGEKIFDISTKTPLAALAPMEAAATVYYDITGTGASAMIYEYVP